MPQTPTIATATTTVWTATATTAGVMALILTTAIAKLTMRTATETASTTESGKDVNPYGFGKKEN